MSELPADLCSQVAASLKIDEEDGAACARSARLWEDTLESYRIPFLLLRVADMRMSLGSRVTALALYVEVSMRAAQLGTTHRM